MSTSPRNRLPYPSEFRARAVELARLRREVALLKEEREILRTAAAYFAREGTTR